MEHPSTIDAAPAYAAPVADLLKRLGSDRQGLDPSRIQKSQKTWGINALVAHRNTTAFLIFARQFASPLVIVLIAAVLFSIAVGEAIDAVVVGAVIVLNIFVGFTQEWKAEEAFRELAAVVLVKAQVRRRARARCASSLRVVPSDQVVVGDIIELDAGDVVPADARVLESRNFQVSEALLTGESLPVDKRPSVLRRHVGLAERVNMVFWGTHVTRGTAVAVVTAVGSRTEFGRIAELTATAQEQETPLQQQLGRLAKMLAVVFIELSTLLFLIGVLQGRSISEMARIAVAVSIAAIPEGLLVGMTVILVLGMKRLLAQGAYVRRLVATEALGAVSVVATDKTGTLTEGRMSIASVVRLGSIWQMPADASTVSAPSWVAALVRCGVWSSHVRWIETGEASTIAPSGDAVERALVDAAARLGIDAPDCEATPRIDELPFDNEHKLMAVLREPKRGVRTLMVKGAPERVLIRCSAVEYNEHVEPLNLERRLELEGLLTHLLQQGLRVLAVAERMYERRFDRALAWKDVDGLTFLGFIVFADPIRPDVPAAVAAARRAGVRTIMLTGDHAITAERVALAVGMHTEDGAVIDGTGLDAMDDHELQQFVKRDVVFARVEPRQKLRIIQALRENGEVVAMIGDGVNDAPALKVADVGVAVGSGSDVAKEVADLVLLNDSFATFAIAIREGRVIVSNIRKVLLFLLVDSFSELILIGGALIAGLPSPLLPLQILWINMIADGFPHLALTAEKEEPGAMDQPPRRREEPLLSRDLKVIICGMALITNGSLLFLYTWFANGGVEIPVLRTLVFAVLGISSLFYVFSCRSLSQSLFQMNPFSNPFLILAFFMGTAIHIAGVELPFFQRVLGTTGLSWGEWAFVFVIALGNLGLIEFFKAFVRWYPKREMNTV